MFSDFWKRVLVNFKICTSFQGYFFAFIIFQLVEYMQWLIPYYGDIVFWINGSSDFSVHMGSFGIVDFSILRKQKLGRIGKC